MKIWLAILLSGMLIWNPLYVNTTTNIQSVMRQENEQEENAESGQEGEIDIGAPSALLMEASTGKVVYEKNADEKLPPASVTKVMTLLLIFDAVESGKIHLEDEVTTSEYAASMGGSQVFLEVGEVQTVDTMIKCIAVASANDACVAMAEYIWGSEDEFVSHMNQRAEELGMQNTKFVNCNGLDADGHVTTARDIALMSRELIETYPEIHDYSMIWMENITHTTSKGTSEFGLSNTNKLVKQYQYTTGLKTGSTSLAKFCISATAKKNDVEMIAVIMAAPDPKTRFGDATKLLNYGFGKCQLYQDENPKALKPAPVYGGLEDNVKCVYKDTFRYLSTTGENLANVSKKIVYKKNISAPVKKGDAVGTVFYKIGKKDIGNVDIVADGNVKKAGILDYFRDMARELCF
ncbi:MAG: D-alanyl-D-alanine carboxypeptidase [Hespellia sp.]|nr:D-alanyl-D-alanine carboxypeptidase [Hespellia sp.]